MSALQEAISKAIGAHGMWKTRLKMAIETGKVETPVPTIKMDNQCEFGKWLYGATIPDAAKNSTHYKTVVDLHAKFHQAAGRVAELATAGKKADAEKSMEMGGEFSTASSKLTSAMMEWRDKGA